MYNVINISIVLYQLYTIHQLYFAGMAGFIAGLISGSIIPYVKTPAKPPSKVYTALINYIKRQLLQE